MNSDCSILLFPAPSPCALRAALALVRGRFAGRNTSRGPARRGGLVFQILAVAPLAVFPALRLAFLAPGRLLGVAVRVQLHILVGLVHLSGTCVIEHFSKFKFYVVYDYGRSRSERAQVSSPEPDLLPP